MGKIKEALDRVREAMKAHPKGYAHTPEGREVPDPVPMAPPLGYVYHQSMTDRVRELVRSEHLRLAALQAQADTFSEADDFDVDEDIPNLGRVPEGSEYEEKFDPVEDSVAKRLREKDFRARVLMREEEFTPKEEKVDGRTDPDKGRVADRDRSARDPDKKRKGDAGKEQDADDE